MIKYAYLILICLCFLAYANSLNNAFVSDDMDAIVRNPFILDFQRYIFDPASLLNSLNYAIGKLNPFIYHLTNIILHSLNTLLVFTFLKLIFTQEASFWGAALFATHPIHTEAVTWVSGRGHLVIAFFLLCTCILYFRSTYTSQKKYFYYFLCLLIFSYFIVGQFSFYPLLPFLLILSDVSFKKWRKNWKLWIPFLAILVIRLILSRGIIYARIANVAVETGENKTSAIFNLVYSLLSHAGLLLWPVRLTIFQDKPTIFYHFALKFGLIFLILLALALYFIFKRSKKIFFAVMLFIIFLTPTYSPLAISCLVAERYIYFPSIALSILACFFYEKYAVQSERRKSWAIALFIFIIAIYSIRTVMRNEDWKSPAIFWRKTVLVSDNSPSAHNNMAGQYRREGNIAGAIRELKRTLEIAPKYAKAYNNLGNIYNSLGKYEEAINWLKKAEEINPNLVEAYYNLGIAYHSLGRNKEAADSFKKATGLGYSVPAEF